MFIVVFFILLVILNTEHPTLVYHATPMLIRTTAMKQQKFKNVRDIGKAMLIIIGKDELRENGNSGKSKPSLYLIQQHI